ncbi:uncharacterized protein LOC116424355 [Nomia melanderi]|uniref:uncharacterized protein LOC116424355 n=1 Tax=Nomia melanderi TaxID=2448451 RepID=UPI003FCEE47D
MEAIKNGLHRGRGIFSILHKRTLCELFNYYVQLKKANVFQLNILIPLIKMLDIYKKTSHEISPDEFCIILFTGEEPTKKCQIKYNMVKKYCSHPDEFKNLPTSIQNIIIDLFMNIIRYENFLEGVSKNFLEKRHRYHCDKLHEVMVLIYILAYRIFNLFFEESIDCFDYFKMKKMLFMVSYLLYSETSNLFHKLGCLEFDEDFVERTLILPFMEATSCLEKLRENIKETIEKRKQPKKITIPVFMNVLNHPKRRTGVPPATPEPVEVKQTAASILRECARVISDEEKEIKKLKELSEGGFDPSSIARFEQEERQRKRVEESSKIQEKHLLALISREGAFIAKQSLLDGIKQHAESVRKEKQELNEKLGKWREKHVKEMAEIFERCREIQQASRDALNAMVDEKRQKAAEVSQESRQLRAQMIKQKQKEVQRKIKLIQEIKAIQSLRSFACKVFDPTESRGLGLLCEMSYAELKERLFWMKMKLNEEIENRKVIVHEQREKQKTMIEDTRKALEDYKVSKRLTSSSKSQRPPVSMITSPEVIALRRQLEERKAARLQKEIATRSK